MRKYRFFCQVPGMEYSEETFECSSISTRGGSISVFDKGGVLIRVYPAMYTIVELVQE